MEDDKLKELFSNFQPEMQSDFDFINRLERNLNAVEAVKRHSVMQKRRQRVSFIAGCAAGFIAGMLVSLTVPHIINFISALKLSLSGNGIVAALAEYPSIAAWSVVGTTSVIIALNVYDMVRGISTEYGVK